MTHNPIVAARAACDRAAERLADRALQAGKSGDAVDICRLNSASVALDIAINELLDLAQSERQVVPTGHLHEMRERYDEHPSVAAFAAVQSDSGIDPEDVVSLSHRDIDEDWGPFLPDEED